MPPRKRATTPPAPVVPRPAPIDSKPKEPQRDTAIRALMWAAYYGLIGPVFWPVNDKARHFAITDAGTTITDFSEMPTLPVAGVPLYVAGLARERSEREKDGETAEALRALADYLMSLGKEKP